MNPATTIYGFILFTFVQILVFLFYPQVYHSSAPDLDTSPTFANFRLIGIQECGLILIYCGIAWTNDRALMKMTVFGRMSVVPFTMYCVFVLDAPWTMLFGIVQDVSFGFWTYYTLSNSKTNSNEHKLHEQHRRTVATGMFSGYTRLVLVVAGVLCMYGGWNGLVHPQFIFQQQPPMFSFLHNSGVAATTAPSSHVGVRSVSLIYFLVGCYQCTIGIKNAHPFVFLCCAGYHVNVILAFTFMRARRTDLYHIYHVPELHFPCAAVLFALSLLCFGQVEKVPAATVGGDEGAGAGTGAGAGAGTRTGEEKTKKKN